jgi:O-methyltransferase involved in polyketide biosynthesis
VLCQRVWHFGLAPDQVAGLLDEYGRAEREQVGATEYRDRYLRPVGRDVPVSEIERFVLATKS